ncbi:transposase [Streptomyces sp. NPDC006530]|uniref:transposase n=1 Tax=Streptomyces sp. NPDC006530 TaxID=3364750 RepID=UPI003680FEE1
MTGLLAPRERNKTITCLAGAEPVTGSGMPGVQRLQFFLSESPWEAEQVNDRRLELLRERQATAPHDGGVIVIDDSGDRKDGTATTHVGRQWLGRYGKTDNGIVTVTTMWTDGRTHIRCTRVPAPRPPFRPWPGRSRLPHQAADLRRPGPTRQGGGIRLPGRGGRLRLLHHRRVVHRPAGSPPASKRWGGAGKQDARHSGYSETSPESGMAAQCGVQGLQEGPMGSQDGVHLHWAAVRAGAVPTKSSCR